MKFKFKIKEWLGLTYFTSELDEFLIAYDEKNPKLSSQQRKEITKYAQVFRERDHSQVDSKATTHLLWEKF